MNPPAISSSLLAWFRWYCRRYLARNFHALRMLKTGVPTIPDGRPLVVFMNHAAWWDPLIGVYAAERFFPGRQHYVPIDSRALDRYKFFARIGFFGLDLQSPAAGSKFLRLGLSILRQQGATIWITPQGRFADPRQRPIRFQPGLARLVRRSPSCVVLPLAVEFPFWEEKTPETLLAFGVPIFVDSQREFDGPCLGTFLAGRLQETMDRLAAESIARRSDAFEMLLPGTAGVGGIYDLWRRFRARLAGNSFQPQHGSL